MNKSIKGYEGLYEISDEGNVFSCERRLMVKNQHKEYVHFVGRRELRSAADKKGYLRVAFFKNNKLTTFKVHRLVAIAFIPNVESKPEVNHINGIKNDNRKENLEWVTTSENIKHAIASNLRRSPRGENVHTAKLTEKKVKEIIDEYRSGGLTNKELANKFGITAQHMSQIAHKKAWGYLWEGGDLDE